MKLYLFGAPHLELAGRLVEIDTRKALALLAYLVMNRGSHSRDSLVALLYPENDQVSGRGALRRTLSSLRKALNGHGLVAEREQISLEATVLWADVLVFHDLLDGLRGHGHPANQTCLACLEPLQQAVELYREGFLAGFGLRDSPQFDDWQYFQAEALQQEYAGALQKLIGLLARQGDYDAAIARGRQWLALDMLQEQAHCQLMLLYAWSGQRHAALRQYRECVRYLEQELGVPPLDETTTLYQSILENATPAPPDSSLPFTGTASAAVEKVESPPTALPGIFPLVGRLVEQQALWQAYEATRTGRFAAYFFAIEGEAGIGKTRLSDEFLGECRKQGAAVVQGRCYEGETGLAYAPFLDALDSALRSSDILDKLRQIPGPLLTPAASLVPVLFEVFPELLATASKADQPIPTGDMPGAQTRFFEAARRILELSLQGAGSPGNAAGVLFLDDLQWADSASLDLLAYLLHRLERVMILCTWRSDAVPPGHRLRQLLSEAVRQGKGAGVTLPRLPVDAVALLVSAAAARAGETSPGQGISEKLYTETEGNPFFVVEYLSSLRTVAGSSLDDGASWEMPHSVRDLLRSRLAVISELNWQILSAGAAIGRSFGYSILRETSGRSELEVVEGLESLLQHGLLIEYAAGEASTGPSYDFTHEKLRALVYEQTSLARRRLLHQRIAEVFANQIRTRSQVSALAAHHYELAGQAGQAGEYYRLAGDYAWRVYANQEAIGHYQRALACGFNDPGTLHEAIGSLQALAGDYQAALTSLEKAAALCNSPRLPWIEHKIGLVHDRRGDWELAECHFEAAVGELDQADTVADSAIMAERARVMADWSRAVYHRAEPERARELAYQSLELAQVSGEALALAQAHNMLGLLERALRDLTAARAHLEQSLEIASKMKDPGAQAAALNNLARLRGDQGDLSEAIRLTEKALALCEQQDDRHRVAALHNNLADLLHASGQADLAMEHLKRAVVIFAEVGGQAGEAQPEIWKLAEW